MRTGEANRLRAIYFLVFCCTASWLPIFADFLKDRSITGIRAGVILSIPPLMMFIVQPFYGMLADRLGYKKCLLVSSGLASISYVLYLFNGSFGYLLAITVFMAAFYNTLQPLLDSLSLRLANKDNRFSYGSLRIAGAAGWAFTGIVAGNYIDAVNTTVIFIIAALSMLLTFIFSFSLENDTGEQYLVPAFSFAGTKSAFAQSNLILLLIFVTLVSAGATTIWNFYSIYMKENGASASLVGYGISFQGLCELPLFYFSAAIIRRLGIKATLLTTVFATALRLLLYSLVSNPGMAVLIELLHGISWSLFWVVCVEYVNRLVPVDWRATGQSLLYAAYFGIGAILGNFWTGILRDADLKVARIFLLNASVVFIVGLLIWVLVRRPEGVKREGSMVNGEW